MYASRRDDAVVAALCVIYRSANDRNRVQEAMGFRWEELMMKPCTHRRDLAMIATFYF